MELFHFCLLFDFNLTNRPASQRLNVFSGPAVYTGGRQQPETGNRQSKCLGGVYIRIDRSVPPPARRQGRAYTVTRRHFTSGLSAVTAETKGARIGELGPGHGASGHRSRAWKSDEGEGGRDIYQYGLHRQPFPGLLSPREKSNK